MPYNPRLRMYVACSSDGWSRNINAERVLVSAWYRSSDQVLVRILVARFMIGLAVQ